MSFTYDPENIFAKILRGEIPNQTVFENDHALAFRDIHPLAPIHVLIIPKGPYVSQDHFAAEASDAEVIGLTRAIAEVCKLEDLAGGFRMFTNARAHGLQEVPHYHLHIIGGAQLGPAKGAF